VRLRSWPGHGTRFRVTVPRARPTPEPTLYSRPAALAGSQVLPRRVLLVDDETDITDALSAFLQAWGVASETARDEDGAALALQAAAARQQPFDALVCDYRLAEGADGLAASQRLRRRCGLTLPVLLITGETAPERLLRVRDSGVPVLFKPVDPERLLQALAHLASPPSTS